MHVSCQLRIKMNQESKTSFSPKIIAAFDFDGTITYCDSFVPFVFYCKGWIKSLFGFLICLPQLIIKMIKKKPRSEIKEFLITYFFQGMSIEYIKSVGDLYAKDMLPVLCQPNALKRIKWHKQQGHLCILVSASLDIYLKKWAELNEFDHVLCSKLEINEDSLITGKLDGANCRGQIKKERLENLLGPKENYILYAYGDSDGDKEMLSMADHQYYGFIPSE